MLGQRLGELSPLVGSRQKNNTAATVGTHQQPSDSKSNNWTLNNQSQVICFAIQYINKQWDKKLKQFFKCPYLHVNLQSYRQGRSNTTKLVIACLTSCITPNRTYPLNQEDVKLSLRQFRKGILILNTHHLQGQGPAVSNVCPWFPWGMSSCVCKGGH